MTLRRIKSQIMGKKKEKNRMFRMKRFDVGDAHSGNKIGVDGVMIGSWAADGQSPRRILDVGCGCGVISLMMAQRFDKAEVVGIDIDAGSLLDARENVERSEWKERIRICEADFGGEAERIVSMQESERYDLIVSNPPFFESGGDPGESSRMLARHAGSLSPEALVRRAPDMLTPEGRLAMIVPAADWHRYAGIGSEVGLTISRVCLVRGNPNVAPKRAMMEFSRVGEQKGAVVAPTTLTIETAPGEYTDEYRRLGRDFYLKF